jgi:DNA-binding LacI/PurR family transcriptional regulator
LHTQSNFFSHVQHGLHTRLLAQGYHSIFLGAEDDIAPRSVQQVLRQQQLCGVAVLGQVSREFVQAVRAVQPNIVAISFSIPGLCHSVMPNEKDAIQKAVSHLVELGHKHFGWVCGDRGLDYNQRRYAGLVEALAGHGLKLNPKDRVDVEGGDRLAGWKAASQFLAQVSRRSFPTTFVCGNGSLGRGFLNGLMQHGWRVPEQISLVAIDAPRLCIEEHPLITGAHADPEKIGVTAAELLLRSADNPDGVLSDVILPAQLTVRETSGKPAN